MDLIQGIALLTAVLQKRGNMQLGKFTKMVIENENGEFEVIEVNEPFQGITIEKVVNNKDYPDGPETLGGEGATFANFYS